MWEVLPLILQQLWQVFLKCPVVIAAPVSNWWCIQFCSPRLYFSEAKNHCISRKRCETGNPCFWRLLKMEVWQSHHCFSYSLLFQTLVILIQCLAMNKITLGDNLMCINWFETNDWLMVNFFHPVFNNQWHTSQLITDCVVTMSQHEEWDADNRFSSGPGLMGVEAGRD